MMRLRSHLAQAGRSRYTRTVAPELRTTWWRVRGSHFAPEEDEEAEGPVAAALGTSASFTLRMAWPV